MLMGTQSMRSGKSLPLLILVIVLLAAGAALFYSVRQIAGDASSLGSDQPSIASQLHVFAEKGDVAGIEREIRNGAPVDALLDNTDSSRRGMTPLMVACLAGKPDAVRALLKTKANVNTRSRDGKSALIYAAGWG